MAARRLVVVMLVLLAISTLAAALLPPAEDPEPSAPPATRERPPPADAEPQAEPDGLLLSARMLVGRQRPKTVRVEVGDRVQLAVAAPFGDDVEIPGFGRTVPVTEFAPATFDLLADRRGTFGVLTVDSSLVAGRLAVGKPGQRALRRL